MVRANSYSATKHHYSRSGAVLGPIHETCLAQINIDVTCAVLFEAKTAGWVPISGYRIRSGMVIKYVSDNFGIEILLY